MKNYTVTITEAEDLALSYAAYSQQDWINVAVQHRCEMAMDEIVQIALKKSFAEGIQLPTNKDDVVLLAFSNKWIQTAKDHNDNMLIEE
jgi:hypothetical protein